MALNAKWEMQMALNAELRRDSGSKRQMGNVDGFERQTEKK